MKNLFRFGIFISMLALLAACSNPFWPGNELKNPIWPIDKTPEDGPPVIITKEVSGITIKTQPGNLTYTHGDTLSLAGLVVTLQYDDTTTEDVALANFGTSITVSLLNGTALSYSGLYNNQKIKVSYSTFDAFTENNLVINQKELTVTAAHTKQFDGTKDITNPASILTLDGVVFSNIVTVASASAEYISANAGTTKIDITALTLGGSDSGNYSIATPVNDVTVTGSPAGITKAPGAAVTQPVESSKTAVSITVDAVTKVLIRTYDEQGIEYRLVNESGTVVHDWQSSPTFTNLSQLTTYRVQARTKGEVGDNFEPGDISESDPITTEDLDELLISIEQIKDAQLTFNIPINVNNPIVICRDGESKDITVENADYSIEWFFGSVPITTGVSQDGKTLTLSVNQTNGNYNHDINIIGKDFITVIATPLEGPPSSALIVFEVKETN